MHAMNIITLRRSGRVRGAKPEYTKEIVDSFGDDDLPDGAAKKKRRRAEESDDDDEDAERDAMLAAASEFLRAAREAMEQYDGETPSSAEGWHAKALQRWGDHAGKHAAGEERDWETFVTSRLSTPPPPSPHDLLQEYYAADAWQLLCCCILMSRCSSWQTKHRCISGFFEAYPTPSAFWQSVVLSAEADGLGDKCVPRGVRGPGVADRDEHLVRRRRLAVGVGVRGADPELAGLRVQGRDARRVVGARVVRRLCAFRRRFLDARRRPREKASVPGLGPT